MSQLNTTAPNGSQHPPRIRRSRLPDEVLWNILEKLTRAELENALFVSQSFRNVITSGPSGPRRSIDALIIRNDVEHLFTVGAYSEAQNQQMVFDDAADVIALMKSCVVKNFQISHVTVDEALLDTLIKLSTSWAHGHADINCSFSSRAVLERALNDAFGCRKMWLRFDESLEEHLPVLNYTSVRDCQDLVLLGMLGSYFDAEPDAVANWLHQERNGNCERKTLNCGVSATNGTTSAQTDLLHDLVQRFKLADQPQPYHATLSFAPEDDAQLNEGYVNAETDEYLTIVTREAWTEPENEWLPIPLVPRWSVLIERGTL